MTEPINPIIFVDAKNNALYTRLAEKYQITLERILIPHPSGKTNLWGCRINDTEVGLFYYNDITTNGFFTHEMFHLEMNDRGFTDTKDLMELVNATAKKAMIFTGTIGHINNIFAHEKFYNEFIELGYTPNEFVNDYSEPTNIEQAIALINKSFLSTELRNESIEIYITMFFTAKDNRNPLKTNDYNIFLEFLNEKDPTLFDILNSHWNFWLESDTLNNHEILYSMIEQVEGWHKTRIIN
ncbi:MAG: hypothetical protein IPL10_12335 [Bacteroidetes bacterium]|nr:hypothetical protein [Bacteroidota bacterium]